MNYLRLLLPLLFTLPLGAQTTTITVDAPGCPSLKLYAFNGSGFDLVKDFTPVADNGKQWTVEVPADQAAFRYVGTKPANTLPVIIGEKALRISGNSCNKIRGAKAVDSPLNGRYQEVQQAFQRNNQTFNTAMRAYNQAKAKGDSITMKQEAAAIATLDRQKQQLVVGLKEESPIIGRVASMNTYLSFINENKGRYQNEIDYFVNTYFQFVDFQDPAYGELPWTYQGNLNFGQALAAAIPGERLGNILLDVYNQWPADSRAQFLAMSGGFAALAKKKHVAASVVGDEIVSRFKNKFPTGVASIEQQATSLRTFAIGAEAPDFSGESPEGATISLSSLRGKVVLIDFWASWCGPCRKENPNVVRLYQKYKDAGFEILGVSLDKTKDRWVKAIADDQLTWLHISDLKGWRSQFAQQYGVSSIPQTVLLDAEGNILARNLRGEALQQKLAELFPGK